MDQLGNLAVGVTFSHQPQHLKFTIGEVLDDTAYGTLRWRSSPDCSNQSIGDGWADQRTTSGQGFYCV